MYSFPSNAIKSGVGMESVYEAFNHRNLNIGKMIFMDLEMMI